MKTPKRIALIGPPGSGKSTFAVRLSKLLDIPIYHLDRHRFEPGGKKRDYQEFLSLQKALVDKESWIIEGCSFSTFEMRVARADTLIYFHFSCLVCYWRIFKRLFNYKKVYGGLRVFNWEMLCYIWNFDKEKRARIEELKDKYNTVNFLIFKNQKDADLYLRNFPDNYFKRAREE